jgi:hypothetical protein
MSVDSVPADIVAKLEGYRWKCGCGQGELGVSLTRNGAIRGHCFTCGHTIYWNDPMMFRFEDTFCRHKINWKPTKTLNLETRWCPLCRVREFKIIDVSLALATA